VPLVVEQPDDPAAQAIRQVARGVIAMTPAASVSLPVLPLVQVGGAPANGATPAAPEGAPAPAEERKPAGMSLPMA
jgi:ATP-binding protein involved in chromosome partitioning